MHDRENRSILRPHGVTRPVRFAATIVVATVIALATGCIADRVPGGARPSADGGDPTAGRELIDQYGCGACHEIAGVPTATGKVGPPLTNLYERKMLAGRLPNNPDNLARWIRDPQGIAPGVDMPDMRIPVSESHDIAAFLLMERNN